MTSVQPYSARKALPAYNPAWFDYEHQNIQRAMAGIKGRQAATPYDFSARGRPNDDTIPVQRWLDSIAGSEGFFPEFFVVGAPVQLSPRTKIGGVGRMQCGLICTHPGDGLGSTHPINASTAAELYLSDFGITCNHPANLGGGFADVGGTYLFLARLYVEGFRHQILLDQSELVSLFGMSLTTSLNAISGLWIVNGPDHSPGAGQGFTNQIYCDTFQLNDVVGAVQLRDDGGVCHNYRNINANGGSLGLRAAGVIGLVVENLESEGHTSRSILLDSTSLNGYPVGPCIGLDIGRGCALADGSAYEIEVAAALGGEIHDGSFGQMATAAILISGDLVQLKIGDNSRFFGGLLTTAGFLAGTAARVQRQTITQRNQTHVPAPLVAGVGVVVTPATMGFAGTTERIIVGSRLLCANADMTNPEEVTVTAVGALDFTATFLSNKAALWRIWQIS